MMQSHGLPIDLRPYRVIFVLLDSQCRYSSWLIGLGLIFNFHGRNDCRGQQALDEHFQVWVSPLLGVSTTENQV
jgi:hypothetical protein